MKQIPEKGNLRDYSIPELLIHFHKEKRTGSLIFTTKDLKKTLYLIDGEIIFATSNSDFDRLDNMLLRRGEIAKDQYHRVSEIYEKTKMRKGVILVEMGFIKPQRLFLIIKEQIKEIVLSLFEWTEGDFRFKEKIPSIEVITLDSSMEEIIREGIKRARNRGEQDKPFIRTLNELYERIDTMTYYDLLGVKSNATHAEIQKAYIEKVKVYHPDKHRMIRDASLREKLTKVIAMMNEAYSTLNNEKKRREYDRYFFLKAGRDVTTSKAKTAKTYFIRGVDEYRRGNFWGAADLFQKATRIEPEKARHWAHLSLSLSRIPRRAKDAESAILKAIEIEPYNVEYYIHLARFYLNMGLRKRARTQFKKALKIDPDNMIIKEELKRLRTAR